MTKLNTNGTHLSSTAGAVIGLNAAFISILTEWLSDLRLGYCSEGWWLNQNFCCWEIEEIDTEGSCAAWTPWSSFTVGNWLVYVLIAVPLLQAKAFAESNTDLECRVLVFLLLDIGSSCPQLCEICRRLWHPRNQVYIGRVHHERIPWRVDADHQKPDTGMYPVLVRPSVTDLALGQKLAAS